MNLKVLLSCVCFLVLFLIIIYVYIQNGAVDSGILYVDDDKGSDFLKIQNAIDAASEGDTIIVREGTYYEVLSINKSIKLIGADRETTIINNQNSSQKVTVRIDADFCTFKVFTVIGPAVSTDIIGINVTSSHNIISDNIVMNAQKGIRLGENNENNKINHNIILDNQYGISTERSNNNNLSNNKISLDESSTILLTYGIYLHISNNNVISKNNISQCYRGIRIKGSDNSLVFDNSFFKNERGVWCCCGAGNNMIYHNNFIQNSEVHATDDIQNHWDDGNVGNYWDDFQEKYPDAVAMNGIWDTSYNIFNYKKENPKQDRYPLVDPIDI